MAEEKILIDVQLDAEQVASRLDEIAESTANLKAEQDMLKQAYKDGTITTGQYTQAMAQNKDQISWNEKQTKGLAAQLKLLNADQKTYGNTLNDMRQKLADMQKAYAQLDDDMRNSAGGEKFRKEIDALSESVKAAEKGIGDTRRNVGNYPDAFKAAGASVDGLRIKMLNLLKNPWALLIAAIVTVIKQLVDAFKRSEDRMREMKTAMAPVTAGIDLIKKGFDSLAKILSGLVLKAMEKVTEAFGWIARQLDSLGRFFGKEWGLEDAIKQATENIQTLTKAEENYKDHQRRWLEEEAKLRKENAQLEDKAAQKDKYTAEERLAFLDKAIANERKMAEERKKLAQENLRIAEIEASRGENNAEANDNLAAAKAAVTDAETEYYKTVKSLNTKRVQFLQEINKQEEQQTEETEEQKTDDTEKWLRKRQEMRRRYGLISDEEQMQEELAALDEAYAEDLRNTEDYLALKAAIQAKYAKKEEKVDNAVTEKKQDNFGKLMSTAKTVTNAMGELVEQDAENNEEAAKRKKAVSIAGVVMDEANAIASGASAIAHAVEGATAAAAATGPAAPITTPAFIAEMVGIVGGMLATTTSSIVSAKSILSGAFETGGVVGGYTSTPSIHDNTYARVGTGEMILNASQQKQLFDLANAGYSSASLDAQAAVFAAAVAATPAPVMVYEEFNNFADRTATYQEIAKV